MFICVQVERSQLLQHVQATRPFYTTLVMMYNKSSDQFTWELSNQIKSVLLLRQYPQRRPGSVAHQQISVQKRKSQIRSKNVNKQTTCAGSYGRKAKSKRCAFRRLLKDACMLFLDFILHSEKYVIILCPLWEPHC